MKEEIIKIKKWPKEYYASRKDCLDKKLRKCSPSKARRLGVLSWIKPVKGVDIYIDI